MLTDYFVHCPHAGCGWRGSIFPKGNRDAHSPATPASRQIVFECPQCKREWRARIVGDDAVPLPPVEAPAPV
jgi:hypothetical protein